MNSEYIWLGIDMKFDRLVKKSFFCSVWHNVSSYHLYNTLYVLRNPSYTITNGRYARWSLKREYCNLFIWNNDTWFDEFELSTDTTKTEYLIGQRLISWANMKVDALENLLVYIFIQRTYKHICTHEAFLCILFIMTNWDNTFLNEKNKIFIIPICAWWRNNKLQSWEHHRINTLDNTRQGLTL